ncbi:MAG TPA: FHA domain-containing protein [Polyangia bacterium]|jgi:hypothetical protein
MDVGEVRAELESLGTEGFAERYGRFYLVLTDADSLESFAGFVNTESRAADDLSRGRKLDAIELLPIVPRQKNTLRVTVGREGDVDLPLGHRNVSKLHAWFTIAGGLLSLTDGRSKNGTWLNGAALDSDRPVPVDVGDTLRFGSVAATVWGFTDLLAALEKNA